MGKKFFIGFFAFVFSILIFTKAEKVFAFTSDQDAINQFNADASAYSNRVLIKTSNGLFQGFASNSQLIFGAEETRYYFEYKGVPTRLYYNTNPSSSTYERSDFNTMGISASISKLYTYTVIYKNVNLVDRKGNNFYFSDSEFIPPAYVAEGYNSQYPYYLVVLDQNNQKFFVCSDKPFYVNSDMYIHKSSDMGYYFRFDDSLNVWLSPKTLGGYTKVLGGITSSMILYCNHDLYGCDVPNLNISSQDVISSANTLVMKAKHEASTLIDKANIYTYLYDASIEDVKGLTIEKDAAFRINLAENVNWVGGASKDKYNIKWSLPESSGYSLEISVQSKFGDYAPRRWAKQTYNKPWYKTGTFVKVNDKELQVSLMGLGKQLLENVWSNVDTGSWLNIPPTEMYFRYVYVHNTSKTVKYGNWTRLDFSGGSNGIIETKSDIVTTNESLGEDGSTIYEDVEVDGNETKYINASGEFVDEAQSFDAAADSIDNALTTSTDTIKSIGTWVGQVPALVGSMFIFIPKEIIAFIGLSLIVCMVLKIAGR